MNKKLRLIVTLLGLSLIILNPCSSNAQEYWWQNWEKNQFNPVIGQGPDTWFEHVFGSPVIYDDGIYKMWFSGWGVIDNIRRVGYATSTNGFSWNIEDNYIFSGTVLGPNIYIETVLKVNDTLKMWYDGFESINPFLSRIGYAWSMDGINWNEHTEAVLNPGPSGSWDHTSIAGANVIYDGETYHMYYGGIMGIGYATSPNGIDWTKDTIHNPIHWIAPNTFFSGGVMPSGTILYNDTVHMWFTGRVSSPTVRDRIGYGYSTNFYDFTWYEDTAMNYGPMTWESSGVDSPTVLMVEGKYKMWYSGTPPVDHFKIGEADGPVPPCVPVYFTGCDNGDGFDDFILNEIQNTGSGCESLNGTGWSEYHDLGPAEVLPGETYTLTISSNSDMQYATVWVDWNSNGEYEGEEIMIDNFIMEETGVQYDMDFNVPSNITPNVTYNMRAKTNCNAACNDPCENYFYGETEDYLIAYPVGIKEIQNIDFNISPNPAADVARLRYLIHDPSASLGTGSGYLISDLYGIDGRKICELVNQEVMPGEHEIKFNVSDLPDGVYFVRLQTSSYTAIRKLIVSH